MADSYRVTLDIERLRTELNAEDRANHSVEQVEAILTKAELKQ